MRQHVRFSGSPLLMLLLLTALAAFPGCSEDDPAAPAASDDTQVAPPAPPADEMRDLELLAAQPDGGLARLAGHRTTVRLPAGSVDGLAAAIAAAGAGGVVIVRSGLHTESDAVVITQPVSILGEPGAVLQMKCDPDPSYQILDPGLHILNADDVVIWGLTLRPADPVGGVGILVQDSARALIGSNSMTDFQLSVLIHHGNSTRIWNNTVVATGAWLTGALIEADGIIAMNGERVAVRGNTISGGLFGFFASGATGQATSNRFTGNFIGMILCKVPSGLFQLPDGQVVGSEVSATRWLVAGNTASDNFDAGYMVIDGANHNWLLSNAASGNGTVDFDLVGESMRFGFPTPTCFENVVIAGAYQQVTIKDCGEDNHVFGGIAVDTGADPCF